MPCQAIKARFSNIKYDKKWEIKEEKEKIINYLLNRTSNKILKAKIGNLSNKKFIQ